MSRLISAMVSSVRCSIRASDSSASPGLLLTSLRATFNCRARPVSVGPMPSCRSRLSRRLSSSRVLTRRSRELCRSEVSLTACTATSVCRARSSSKLLSAAENASPGALGEITRRPISSLWYTSGSAPEAPSFLEQDGHVGQLQGLGYGLHDRGQHRLGGDRRLDALSQARGHRRWVVSITVHQPVHAALEPAPKRLEQDGHERGGHQ